MERDLGFVRPRICALKLLDERHTFQRTGDLTSATVLGNTIINIHTYAKAQELLDKKSNINSDRPILPMVGELVGWDRIMPLMRYGPEHQISRKMFHQELGAFSAIQKFYEYEEQMSIEMLRRMVQRPDEFYDNMTQCV